VKEDPRERTWQRSLVEFGLGNFDAAAQMTSEFRKPGVPVKYQIGALYTLSQKTKTSADRFRADCAALGIKFGATTTQDALLVLAEDFARAQLVLGADFLLYWLDSPAPGPKPGTEQALRISSELLLQLSEADQHDLRTSLFKRLAEAFPDHPVVREELENQRGPGSRLASVVVGYSAEPGGACMVGGRRVDRLLHRDRGHDLALELLDVRRERDRLDREHAGGPRALIRSAYMSTSH
jgi:hypothetical protein